jgi:16S rRNA processing protein RimM
MAEAPFVEIARVIKAHGLKGELSVAPLVGDVFPLEVGTQVWFVPPPASVRTGRVSGVRPGPKGPLVAVDTVTSIEMASKLGGTRMVVRPEDAPTAYTIEEFDEVGLEVVDESRGSLGEVIEVIETGANDVWVVNGPFGEVLLPVIDDVVLSIDETSRTAHVRLLEGLLPNEGEDA